MEIYVLAVLPGFVLWLVLSEVSHRRHIKRYNEETERLYPTKETAENA